MKRRGRVPGNADNERERFWLGAFLAGAVPFALYLRTMAPTVYGVDSAELSTGAYLLGITHPPGAPAYLLLGHMFTWLPIGDVGYRLNLFSATATALALSLLFVVTRRFTSVTLLAVATSWFVGATYYVWVTAVAAEVYALQGCVFLGLLALALRWQATGTPGLILVFFLVAGLGLGVHPSLALLFPGFALLILFGPAKSRLRSRHWLAAVLCGLLGLSVYAYLPIRYLADLPLNPARDYWQENLASWDGFWWMVSGQAFERHFFSVPVRALPAELASFAYRLWSNFMGLGALLGVVGLAADLRHRPLIHLSLLLMLAGHLSFYLGYGAGDKEMMLLPAYLIWGLWIGLGVDALSRRAGNRAGDGRRFAAPALFAMAAFAAVLNFGFVDLSNDWSARKRGEVLTQKLPTDAWFLGNWPDLRMVEYLQVVEGRRPDLGLADLVFTVPDRRTRIVAEKVRSGRPVYVASCDRLVEAGLRCDYEEGLDSYRVRGGAQGWKIRSRSALEAPH